MFYEPTAEHLVKLNDPWAASWSGGKDSTALVTWVEYLRRTGWITVAKPQCVQSDTEVEDVGLQGVSVEMMAVLRNCGWECAVVHPKIHEKLYNRILGIGNTPIHPGISRMRWCTRSTKIGPMERWRKEHSGGLCLTGLRMGESTMRDGKLKKRGCSAGGECGIPDPSDRTYSPILHWSTCQVIDWLNGFGAPNQKKIMADIIPITRKLVEIYAISIGQSGFAFDEGEVEPEVRASRFGCIGCPAITATSKPSQSGIAKYGIDSPLNELPDVWFEARQRRNRCFRIIDGKSGEDYYGFGPIKMEVRKRLFARIMDIQRRAGIVLIGPEDEKFIRECWANKVYPRRWSEADEATVPPSETPLFDAEEDDEELISLPMVN